MNSPYMPTKAQSEEWETPKALFEKWDKHYHFTLDGAASKENTKCKKFFTKEDDSLSQSWKGHTVWLNPPYNAEMLTAFTGKALFESEANGVTTVMLVPAKTDQGWFHELWDLDDTQFFWIKGRVRFVGAANSSTFPSLVIVIPGVVQ